MTDMPRVYTGARAREHRNIVLVLTLPIRGQWMRQRQRPMVTRRCNLHPTSGGPAQEAFIDVHTRFIDASWASAAMRSE
ncbi:hypothetical protein FOMPIDRAFT_158137 [Fomitopsis schrenkii]|uniref:Uncharacterized protein n=1 Tax=Fomitopsis schrenkii TaxID=2126942 RepID=S8EMT1_FOMSC|nr:hypothetical protein FOMPIDRAFT_158137 [Fomitopsis schrenkii]